MALVLADRVEQVTRTTGLGDLQLAETIRGRQSFQDITNNGDTVIYVLEDAEGVEWEIGTGTVVHGTTTVLQRTTIRQSSNADAKISLSAGTHRVFLAADAQFLTDTVTSADITAAIAAHEAEADPHPQYTTAAEAAAAAPVQSVNGETGTVLLDAADVGATPASHVGTGGAQHADATPSTAGFMSGADKTKLDTVETNAKDDQDAAEVPYSNATSGLTATDVQAALDEIDGQVDTNTSDISTNAGNIATNASNIAQNTSDINQRTIYVGSVAGGISGLTVIDGQAYVALAWRSGVYAENHPYGGHSLVGSTTAAKTGHGIYGWSPTVPPVSAQPGATETDRMRNYLSGNGETDPTGIGLFIINEPDIYLEYFGADMRGAVDSQPSLEKSLTSLEARMSGSGYLYSYKPVLHLGSGRVRVDSETLITAAENTTIIGDGISSFTFDASQAPVKFRSVLAYDGGGVLNYNQYEGFAIHGQDLGVAGSPSKLDYGLYFPNHAHTVYSRVGVRGSTIAGIYHDFGWSSVFDKCVLTLNLGHGLMLPSEFNGGSIKDCQIFANDGFGIWMHGGKGVSIHGGVLEANKMGGAMLNICTGVDLDIYCESNGELGYNYTSPSSINVKADIVINGAASPETTLSGTFPSKAVSVSMYSTPNHVDSHFYIAGCDGFNLQALVSADDTASRVVPAVRVLHGLTRDGDYQVNATVTRSGAYMPPFQVDDSRKDSTNSRVAGKMFSDIVIDKNLAEIFGADPTAYSLIFGSTSTLAIAPSGQYFNGEPTYTSTQDVDGSSGAYGFTFDLSAYEGVGDDYLYAVMWVKATTGTSGFTMNAIDSGGVRYTTDGGSALSANVWTRKALILKVDGTGTGEVSFRHQGGLAGNVCEFTRPILAPLGVRSTEFGQR